MNERAIFDEALQRATPAARSSYLDEACAGDAPLRNRVEALLQSHEHAGSFLGKPAPERLAEKLAVIQDSAPAGASPPATVDALPSEAVGAVIAGRFKLLNLIGEGGMGTVWMAQQTEPVKRVVALKLIKAGMDSKQVIARFGAERQALALMDHPNIAKVFDAGTTGSATEASATEQTRAVAHASSSVARPYFVMELVKGVPITKYCDEHHLTPRQRLELFIPVCQAIQHAHQKGIIHRDIKPSNVLVARYDDRPVPKVIDFGVAKATGQQLTETTLHTGFGTVVGTMEYMSPEQASFNQFDVDTRSDIYSLGVLLYELLAGSPPFTKKDLEKAGMLEMLRIIREQEPSKPSTKLSSSEALPSLSANRGTEPARLTKLVRGELDWIVMKALAKDRNRRYETANGFAMDVQRYLADEPVQACPPSVGYRLRKLVRRHRVAVVAVAAVILALVGGIIGTTWGMLRATTAETAAVNEAKQKDDALQEKVAALADARDQLYLALVNEARAKSGSGRVGQRFEALKAIRAAARIRITPELRTEAMAALVLPDAEVAQEWERSIEGIANVIFDASFKNYAVVDKQGDVIVCWLSNGREEIITRLPADGKGPSWGVVMSPDARFVASRYGPSNSMAGGVRVWKVDGSKRVVLLPEPPGVHGYSLAFHPSGGQLAVGHPDKSVSVYDLATGQRVQRLMFSAAPVHLDFHPREHQLAVACGNAVQRFDTATGKELPALHHPAAVSYLSWHPDGRRLAVGCYDRKIHLWDTRTATEVMSPWTGHTADGLVVAFNHAGDRLASDDWSGRTRLWDTAAGRMLLTLPGSLQLRFSSDGRLFGPEYNAGKKVRVWRLADGRELRVLRPRSAGSLDNIVLPVVDADGRILAAGASDQLCFFDLGSGEELASVRLPRVAAAWPAFFDPPHPPQRSGGFMTGGQSGLYLWPARQDPARPEVMRIGPPQQLAPNPGGGYSVGASASADGRVVAVPQGYSTLVLYRDRPERRMELGPQHDVRFSAVSPDGRWVVTSSWGAFGRSKTIKVWDADTGLLVRDLADEDFASARFSPDGRWLMTRTSSGSRQWEVGAWREVRRFDQGGGFAFSPDSRLLAINDGFSVICLVETTTGREVARLTGPDPTRYSPACFTPDGTRLVATCSHETALYVWDLQLIRQQLKELGLDWDWPDFRPADPRSQATTPLKVEVLPGELGGPSASPPEPKKSKEP